MTDDLSHLDELVEREAAPTRSRRPPAAKPEAEPADAGAVQPEWTRAFMGLVERLVDRLVRVEDGLIDVRNQLEAMERGVERHFLHLEGEVVNSLQPMLLRRHDDVIQLQSTLNAVADDVQALHERIAVAVAAPAAPAADLRGAVTEVASRPHQPAAHPARDFAAPTFEPDLPFVEAAPPARGEDDTEDRTVTAAVFHLPPDYFEERGSVPHRGEPRHRPPEGDVEGGRHDVREQRAQH